MAAGDGIQASASEPGVTNPQAVIGEAIALARLAVTQAHAEAAEAMAAAQKNVIDAIVTQSPK